MTQRASRAAWRGGAGPARGLEAGRRRRPSELPQSFPDTVRGGGGAGVRRQVEGGVTAFTGDPLLPGRTQRGRVFSDVSAVSSITGQTGHGGFSRHWSRPNTRGAARPSRWDAWRPRRDPRCRPAHGVFRIPQSARHSRPRAVWKLTARVVQVCAGDTEARAEQTARRQVRGTALRESEREPSALRLTRTLRSRRKQVWGRVGHRRSHERPRGATRGHAHRLGPRAGPMLGTVVAEGAHCVLAEHPGAWGASCTAPRLRPQAQTLRRPRAGLGS